MEAQRTWICMRARAVTELVVRRDGANTVLVVRSQGRGGAQSREIRAPEATAMHAARAIARHYGLSQRDTDRWLQLDHAGRASAA